MQNRAFFRGFFLVAALYDLILGVAFFFLYPWVYGLFGIALPAEPAYLHVAAAFVFVQGFMYLLVYRNLEGNRDLVLAGAVYKTAYIGVSFFHWGMGTLPHSIFALFGVLDLIFLVGFIWYLRTVNVNPTPGELAERTETQ
jgi:hypothetical protein